MTSWIGLYSVVAEYESDVIDITSDFDFYVADLKSTYQDNDGFITLEMRMSLDNGFTWTDYKNPFELKFDGDYFSLSQVKVQYRVKFDMSMNVGGNSPVFDKFDFKLIGTYKIINYGDLSCKPELWIRKTNGSGNIKLINEANGQSLELTNLNDGETVYIDCENEDIVTDLPLKYRYNDHNGIFLELEIGENYLAGEGDFELDMRMQFKTLQG
jgi:hypothetical protein